ncbi:MAG: DUF6883 domain-containing protein [Anaerovoracaceae bacterium]|jgi:hypothetical protein
MPERNHTRHGRESYCRHDNCDCNVDYVCEKNKQNVWSKKWRKRRVEEKNSRVASDKKASNQLLLEDKQAKERRIATDNKSELLPNAEKAVIPNSKIPDFLLKEGAKHSKEFYDVGYTENDSELLYNDIIKGINRARAQKKSGKYYGNRDRYSVIILLGKTKKKKFVTIWQMIDDIPTFVTAHRID